MPGYLYLIFGISPGQEFPKYPNVSKFETGPSRPARGEPGGGRRGVLPLIDPGPTP
jgi:hypothetical protein